MAAAAGRLALRLGTAALAAPARRGGAAWAPSGRLPAAAATPRMLMGSARRRWLPRRTLVAAFHSADGRPEGTEPPVNGSSTASAGAADASAGRQQLGEPPHHVNWQTGVVLAGASFEAYGVLAEPGLALRSEQGTEIHFVDGWVRSAGGGLLALLHAASAHDSSAARCR